jgi:hypothetical protein
MARRLTATVRLTHAKQEGGDRVTWRGKTFQLLPNSQLSPLQLLIMIKQLLNSVYSQYLSFFRTPPSLKSPFLMKI